MARFCARARKRDDLPSVSIKDVYRHPTITGLAAALAPAPAVACAPSAAPSTASPAPVAEAFAEVLAGVLDVEQVSVDAHFFDDLGADSMVMARFCARARKRDDLPSVSIKDVYRHPTADRLAAAFACRRTARRRAGSGCRAVAGQGCRGRPGSACPGHGGGPGAGGRKRRSAGRCYVLCGVLQFLIFVAYSSVAALVAVRGFDWVSEGLTWWDLYRRSVVFASGTFVAAVCAPDRGEVGAGRPVAADARSGCGAWPTSGSGWSRSSSGRARWRCSSGRRSTCSTCGPWARRSGGVSRSSPGTCPSARICSRSAPAR